MNPSSDNLSFEERVRLGCIRQFFGNTRFNMISMLVGGMAVTGVLYTSGTDSVVLVLLALAFIVVCTLGWLFDRRIQRQGVSPDTATHDYHIRFAFGIAISVLYGFSSFLMPTAPTHNQDVFFFTMGTSTTAMAIFGFAATPRYYLSINLAFMGPLAVHFILRYLTFQDSLYAMLLALLVAWQILTISKARQVTRTALNSLVFSEQLKEEIEEHKRSKQRIEHMALHDPLTGLANRRYFDQTLKRTLSNAQRDKSRFGVLSVDLNDFKPVNDKCGHAAGDELLKAVAERFTSTIRAGDFCARMGGDEFSLIAGSVRSDADLLIVASKIRAAVAEPYVLRDLYLQINTSIGWAVYPDDGTDAETLCSAADERMYRDKRFGKQKWEDAEGPASGVRARQTSAHEDGQQLKPR